MLSRPMSLYSFTYNLAEEISRNAPLSLKGHKMIFRMLHHYQGLREEDRLTVENKIAEAFKSDDLIEGTTALFQKRSPRFKGR